MKIEYNTLEERKLFLEAGTEFDLAFKSISLIEYVNMFSDYSPDSHFGFAYPFDECPNWVKDRVKKESSSDEMYQDFVEFYNETILSYQKKCDDRRKEDIANRAKENLKQSTCQDSPYQTQKERHEEQRGFDNDAYCNDDEPKKFSLSDYDEY
jgi:hypothetical protein